MRIVLLEIEGHGPAFIDEPPLREEEALAARRHGRIRRWLHGKRSKLLDDLDRSRGIVGRTLGGVWARLQRLISPDESLLRELRRSGHLVIDHPARLSAGAVREDWTTYLASRQVKHRKWLIVDAILAPLSIVLGPLPGPNVVCYWLFYRSVTHFMAHRGAARASTGKLPTTLRQRAELDATIRTGDDERIARLAEVLEFPDLSLILLRLFPDPEPSDPGESE